MKLKKLCPGLQLRSLILFPMTVTVTLSVPPKYTVRLFFYFIFADA